MSAFAYFRGDRFPLGQDFANIRTALAFIGHRASLLDTVKELGHTLVRVELSENADDRQRERLGLEHFLRGAIPDVTQYGYTVDGVEQRVIDWSEDHGSE